MLLSSQTSNVSSQRRWDLARIPGQCARPGTGLVRAAVCPVARVAISPEFLCSSEKMTGSINDELWEKQDGIDQRIFCPLGMIVYYVVWMVESVANKIHFHLVNHFNAGVIFRTDRSQKPEMKSSTAHCSPKDFPFVLTLIRPSEQSDARLCSCLTRWPI
jgi:hypothetical protein